MMITSKGKMQLPVRPKHPLIVLAPRQVLKMVARTPRRTR